MAGFNAAKHVTAACDPGHKPDCEPNHNGLCLKAQPSQSYRSTL